MKLTKLVYIAHGWYLGFTGKVLIDENPEAWKYGPVIPTIYHAFKSYGSSPIRSILDRYSCDELPENVVSFLNRIWDVYGEHTAIELSSLTHQIGTPWFKVWHRTSAGVSSGLNSMLTPVRQIPDSLIENHYSEKISGNEKSFA